MNFCCRERPLVLVAPVAVGEERRVGARRGVGLVHLVGVDEKEEGARGVRREPGARLGESLGGEAGRGGLLAPVLEVGVEAAVEAVRRDQVGVLGEGRGLVARGAEGLGQRQPVGRERLVHSVGAVGARLEAGQHRHVRGRGEGHGRHRGAHQRALGGRAVERRGRRPAAAVRAHAARAERVERDEDDARPRGRGGRHERGAAHHREALVEGDAGDAGERLGREDEADAAPGERREVERGVEPAPVARVGGRVEAPLEERRVAGGEREAHRREARGPPRLLDPVAEDQARAGRDVDLGRPALLSGRGGEGTRADGQEATLPAQRLGERDHGLGPRAVVAAHHERRRARGHHARGVELAEGRCGRRNPLVLAGAWVAVVLLFWLGLFVPAMRPGIFRPEAVDLYGYFFPKFVYGSAELERGALPLWNPYEYAGVPFLGAAQPAVLYPPRVLLFALLPPTAALHVFMVVHYVLLGAGAYVMLRGLALEVPGACFGTLLLAFEPFMMAGHYHPPRIACFAWVPWMVAAFVRTVQGRGLGATLGLAVAAALQATAGYPEYSLDTALVLALFWPAAARRVRGARAALGGSALVVAAAALAAMLSAVQLVSLVETFRTSTPGGRQLPFLAGQRFELATFGSGLRGWAAAVGVFAYLPALAWALVFVGLAAPERPYRGALAAVWVLASIVFAPALRALPPFNLFRPFLCRGSTVVLPLAALAAARFERVPGGRLA